MNTDILEYTVRIEREKISTQTFCSANQEDAVTEADLGKENECLKTDQA